MKRVFFFSLIFIFLISIITNSYAFGIAQEYIEDNTLKLYPGEKKDIKLTLQNSGDNELKVVFTVTGDEEIVDVYEKKEIYVLPPKSYNTEIYLNFTIPKDSKVNDTYRIRYGMAPYVTNETSESIIINTKISQPINVLVVPKPKVERDYSLMKTILASVLGLIILVAALWRLGLLVNKKFIKK